jgi:hypothetical protein
MPWEKRMNVHSGFPAYFSSQSQDYRTTYHIVNTDIVVDGFLA